MSTETTRHARTLHRRLWDMPEDEIEHPAPPDEPELLTVLDALLRKVAAQGGSLDLPTLHEFMEMAFENSAFDFQSVFKVLIERTAAADTRTAELAAKLGVAVQQLEELGALLKRLEHKPAEVLVTRPPFPLNCSHGEPEYAVRAIVVGGGGHEVLFRVLDVPDSSRDASALLRTDALPEKYPYPAIAELSTQTLLGPALHVPGPDTAIVRRAVAVQEGEYVYQIQIEATGGERQVVIASPDIGRVVEDRIEQGDSVMVTLAGGTPVVNGVDATEMPDGPWVETLDPATSPTFFDSYVMPKSLWQTTREMFAAAAAGETVLCWFLGPTGVGKTSYAMRFGPSLLRWAGEECPTYLGIKVFHMEQRFIGSKWAHETSRNIQQLVEQAIRAKGKGYFVIVIIDEGDTIAAESTGLSSEQHFNLEERATLLQVSSDPRLLAAGVMVFVTTNKRRGFQPPPEVLSRFHEIEWPRPSRDLIAKVAEVYAAQYPQALDGLGATAAIVGAGLADHLFGQTQPLALLHMQSGAQIPLFRKDLSTLCPRVVERIVVGFLRNVERGVSQPRLPDLYRLADSQLLLNQAHPSTVFEHIFTPRPANDTVKLIEKVS